MQCKIIKLRPNCLIVSSSRAMVCRLSSQSIQCPAPKTQQHFGQRRNVLQNSKSLQSFFIFHGFVARQPCHIPSSMTDRSDNEEVEEIKETDTLISRTLEIEPPVKVASSTEEWSVLVKGIFCFVGLQLSYLTWGMMQEIIMTTKFEPTAEVPSGYFPSASFCVLANRVVAILVAYTVW